LQNGCFLVALGLQRANFDDRTQKYPKLPEGNQGMDTTEFQKRVKPRAKRSKLEPFQLQIFELKTKGYAIGQICEWLAENDVKVSRQGLAKFIKSHDFSAPPPSMPGANTAQASAAPKVSPAPPVTPKASEVDEFAGLSPKQRRQKIAEEYFGTEDNPSNSLINRFFLNKA
jgi:hypothetical protein